MRELGLQMKDDEMMRVQQGWSCWYFLEGVRVLVAKRAMIGRSHCSKAVGLILYRAIARKI